MIATIAVIAAIAGKCFPYDRYDRCERCHHWKVTVFHTIAMIVAITELFFLSDHSDHNDNSMENRLYRWLFLLLILEKWMIHRFRPSQKVWTKFRQNLHQSYFVCLFFFLIIQSIQAQKKGTQKLFIEESSEDCQAHPKEKTAFIKPNWRRNTQIRAF